MKVNGCLLVAFNHFNTGIVCYISPKLLTSQNAHSTFAAGLHTRESCLGKHVLCPSPLKSVDKTNWPIVLKNTESPTHRLQC